MLGCEENRKIENIEKTRKYIEKININETFDETPKRENKRIFTEITKGIEKGSEKLKTEFLRLILEIVYKDGILLEMGFKGLNYLVNGIGIEKYLEKKMKDLRMGKEKLKEKEYLIIMCCSLFIDNLKISEENKKRIIQYICEMKMEETRTREDKKKRMKEILGIKKIKNNKSCLKDNIL